MTTANKIAMVQTLLAGDPNATDTVVATYLDLAKQTLLRTMYPYGCFDADGFEVTDPRLPARYDGLHCELAARYFARRGGLGEIAHNENGINRTWASEDDTDLLKQVCPMAKVV